MWRFVDWFSTQPHRRSLIFILGSFDWGILDRWDLVLDHWSHWVWVVSFRMLWGFGVIIKGGNLMVDDWLLWFWVFSCISNNWWVSFDCRSVHWDIVIFLLCFLLWGLLILMKIDLVANIYFDNFVIINRYYFIARIKFSINNWDSWIYPSFCR